MTAQLGLTNLKQEFELHSLAIDGALPQWLDGDLYRNGPALFSIQNEPPVHWFDGLAMIHRFSIENGVVSYCNRFLRSDGYLHALQTGSISSPFGGNGSSTPAKLNPNVNIAECGGSLVAMTEAPYLLEFDPHSLDTLGTVHFEDTIGGQLSTAHPQIDHQRQQIFNFNVEFGRVSKYHVYSMDLTSRRRALISSIDTADVSYMHSFAMTERSIILIEFPVIFNMEALLTSKSITESLHYNPNRGTKFTVIDKVDGTVRMRKQGPAGFAFHVVNAFELGNEVCVDLAAYEDVDAVHLLKPVGGSGGKTPGRERFIRYRLSANRSDVLVEELTDERIELPTVFSQRVNGRPYSFAYAVSVSKTHPETSPNQLVKVSVNSGHAAIWREVGCYPGEPIFVPRSDGSDEDDGVVLSVVLDSLKGKSFLLVLDAKTFEERARSYVSHHIPFGFHGMFKLRGGES